jgi:hypothetical protein
MKSILLASFSWAFIGSVLFALPMAAAEPEWSASRVKDCDRDCPVGFMDGYMNAIYKHDAKGVPPLAIDVRMTGQVALQARILIQGRGALVAVRLKVNRGQISEIEQLYDRNINDAAIPLLTTPRPGLVDDLPASERESRDVLYYAANSYFDALEGDDGKIAAFADNCVRHENGYQTVNNPPPGGRMMPAPPLPNPDTPQGKEQLRFSMLTCSQQIESKIFSYMKHIRPRHAVIIDQQRGVATDAPPGMLMNAMIVESFGIRGGKIHEVEAMPFVTIPYGLGDGWTEGSGR